MPWKGFYGTCNETKFNLWIVTIDDTLKCIDWYIFIYTHTNIWTQVDVIWNYHFTPISHNNKVVAKKVAQREKSGFNSSMNISQNTEASLI